MLKVVDLVKSFEGTKKGRGRSKSDSSDAAEIRAIDQVSFEVEPGEMFTLLGPSGCGKSTTLRSIAGLERPDAGQITIGGRTVYSSADRVCLPPNDRKLSMVFQSYAIWPHMNVFDNVAFPLQVQKGKRLPAKEIRSRVERVLETVHLGSLGPRSAVKLSGGQQQRLALARALVTDPQLVLLDEPLSNLDAKLRESMRLELKRLQLSLGLTSIYVTHDQGEALALSSRIAVMDQGRIVQVGRPREIYESPSCRFVADFIGTSNAISGMVRAVDGEMADIETPLALLRSQSWVGLKVADEVALLIRPEDMHLTLAGGTESESTPTGRVVAAAYLGEAIDYVVAVGSAEYRCRAKPSEYGLLDREVSISIDPSRVHVLPAEDR